MKRATQLRISKGIVVIAAVNFVAFAVESMYLGGDAGNGMISEGRYYVGSHGQYTIVSAAVFTISKWHAYSVWCTHALGFLAFAWHAGVRDETRAAHRARED
jgi:hypothetical protein